MIIAIIISFDFSNAWSELREKLNEIFLLDWNWNWNPRNRLWSIRWGGLGHVFPRSRVILIKEDEKRPVFRQRGPKGGRRRHRGERCTTRNRGEREGGDGGWRGADEIRKQKERVVVRSAFASSLTSRRENPLLASRLRQRRLRALHHPLRIEILLTVESEI